MNVIMWFVICVNLLSILYNIMEGQIFRASRRVLEAAIYEYWAKKYEGMRIQDK
jgi:hypothetical protein